MINLSVSGSSIIFEFDDNQHYLNDGVIEAPINSLTLVTDESEMATFKKAASNDIFISALYSELGMTKDELIEFYTTNMVGSTGGGLTPEEAQEMIDDSISGKADTSAVTESISEAISGKADTSAVTASIAAAVSGKADTSAVTEAISEAISGKADTSAVTEAISAAVSGKQDALVSGTNIKTVNNESLLGSGNIEIEGGNNVIEVTQAEYNALVSAGTVDLTAIYVITDAPEIDMSNYYTSVQTNSAITAAVSGKADTSAVTASINAAVSGKADSSAVTESINAAVSGKMDTSAFTAYSASTDARISQDEEVTARALVEVNDALSGKADASGVTAEITAAVSGKQDTLSAGTNITISGNVISAEGGGKAVSGGTNISVTTGATADTINCTLPITASTRTQGSSTYINLQIVRSGSNSFNHTGCTDNFVNGYNNTFGSVFEPSNKNFVFGHHNTLEGNISSDKCAANFVFGDYNVIGKQSSNYALEKTFVGGDYNSPKNDYETVFGKYNNSVSGSSTFGDSGNTLFSLGNGTADNARHNAFEIRQNGDIYCNNGTSDVKLQDYLQVKVVQISQSDYDQLQNKDANTLYLITNS